ncbi:hypothetical protein VTK26DRAFT_8480 [Humicola hyalothermophila]
MAQPAQSSNGYEPKPSERIPPLTNIAPAIFVPLRQDLFEDEPPRDRVDRVKRLLAVIDYQREGVLENLLYMFEREKRRVVQHAAVTEQALPTPRFAPGALPPDEADAIIANMEALAEPGVDYNIREMPLVDGSATIPPETPLRDKTVMELINVVEKAVSDLHGFDGYMRGIKERYLKCLERELETLEQAGKRPEERVGAKKRTIQEA